jgi:hypothetical protein
MSMVQSVYVYLTHCNDVYTYIDVLPVYLYNELFVCLWSMCGILYPKYSDKADWFLYHE